MSPPLRSGSVIISIHAPMKGATRQVDDTSYDQVISIHAPMKGATIWKG